jgi:hypothetical protein
MIRIFIRKRDWYVNPVSDTRRVYRHRERKWLKGITPDQPFFCTKPNLRQTNNSGIAASEVLFMIGTFIRKGLFRLNYPVSDTRWAGVQTPG